MPEGTPLVLDGDAGAVYVDPAPALVREYERRSVERKEEARRALASAQRPAQTQDGRRIEVVANVGSPADVDAAVANGAEGVGLLRTEFLFLERDSLPTEDEQYAAYATWRSGCKGGRSSCAPSTSARTSRFPTCRGGPRRIPSSASAESGSGWPSRTSSRPSCGRHSAWRLHTR